MSLFFWYLGKSDLASVQVYSGVQCHIIEGTRKTRPYLTGRPVDNGVSTGRIAFGQQSIIINQFKENMCVY